MRLAYYVDSHGFGHATRAVALAAAMPAEWEVLFRTNAPAWLFEEDSQHPCLVYPSPLDLHPTHSSGYRVDPEASFRVVRSRMAAADQLIEDEADWLREKRIDLVFSDISPLALVAAQKAGLPGYGVSNFTWDWIYEPLFSPEAVERVLRPMAEMYQQARVNFRLPFSTPEVFPSNGIPTPLLVRSVRSDPKAFRRLLGMDQDKKYILISFGGFDHPGFQFERLEQYQPWQFLVAPRGLTAHHSSVPRLVRDPNIANLWQVEHPSFYHPDLVAAVDAVLTKPGYGILSECMANTIPMILDRRDDFREFQAVRKTLRGYPQIAYLENQAIRNLEFGEALQEVLACTPLKWTGGVDGARFILDYVCQDMAQQAC